jgi:hypothetical protein
MARKFRGGVTICRVAGCGLFRKAGRKHTHRRRRR